MLNRIKITSLCAALLIAGAAIAQSPTSAPAGSTGMCKDGTYWSGATKKGACHGHKGVQDWYGASAAPGSTTTTTPAAATATPAAATPPAAPVATTPKASTVPAATAAPGGGAGKVWVNSSSKVYHCSTDRWYGKTKSGAYMTEAEAVAQGNRADHGKACSK